jgi:hypothetical protein
LTLILEGHRARQRREAIARREESAWMVSWLLVPYKSADADPITPDQLMGRKPRGKPTPVFASEEDKARALVAAFAAKSKKKRLTDGQ